MGKIMKIEDLEINVKIINAEMPWKENKENDCVLSDGYHLRSFLDRVYHLNRLANFFSKIFVSKMSHESSERYPYYNSYIACRALEDYIKKLLPKMNIIILEGSRYLEHGTKSLIHSCIFIESEGKRNLLDLMPLEYGTYFKDKDGNLKLDTTMKIASYFPVLSKFENNSCNFFYPVKKKLKLSNEFLEASAAMIAYIKMSLERIDFSAVQGTVDLEEFIKFIKEVKQNDFKAQ